VIFGKPVEDDGRNCEFLARKTVDVGVERQEAVLAVDGPEDPSRSGTFSSPTRPSSPDATKVSFSSQLIMTAPGIDGRSLAWRHCS
jgi:hypothetical protein